MAVNHSITVGWQRGSESRSHTVTKAVGGGQDIDEAISANQTDKLVALNLDVSQLKTLWIEADVAMTLETNDGSSPDDTLTLVANEPVAWWDGCGWACPLTADVTGLYVTNTTAGTLRARFGYDPTV